MGTDGCCPIPVRNPSHPREFVSNPSHIRGFVSNPSHLRGFARADCILLDSFVLRIDPNGRPTLFCLACGRQAVTHPRSEREAHTQPAHPADRRSPAPANPARTQPPTGMPASRMLLRGPSVSAHAARMRMLMGCHHDAESLPTAFEAGSGRNGLRLGSGRGTDSDGPDGLL